MRVAPLLSGPSRAQAARQPASRPRDGLRGLSPDAVRALSRTAGNRAVVRLLQRCPRCGNPSCQAGEVCQHGHHGMFSHGMSARPVAPYSQAKQSSAQYKWEAEHMMPAAAWQHSGLAHRYADLPAMSIGYDMHRGGQSGAGGGVTSTGSSTTAKDWSRKLGGQLADPTQREQAFLSVAADEYNAALMTGRLNEGLVWQIIQTLNLHVQAGHLTQEQAGRIQNAIMNRWLNDQTQQDDREVRQAAGWLMGLGKGAW